MSTLKKLLATSTRRERAKSQTVSEDTGKWQADLVVDGTHERRGVARVLPGSRPVKAD